MDIVTIAGLVGGLTTIFVVLIMDGGSPAELFAHPSAILLIIGGSLSATILTSPLQTVIQLPKYFIQAFTTKKFDARATIELLTNLGEVPEEGALAVVAFPKPKDGAGFPARVFAILP